MFKNAGGKLKALALIHFWYIAICSVMLAITLIQLGSNAIFVLVIPAGIVWGWLSSILLYAFGELCENVYHIWHQNSDENAQGLLTAQSCPCCHQYYLNENGVCLRCGYVKNENE